MKRTYDSTVARMAGNIAAGLVSVIRGSSTEETAKYLATIAVVNVELSRAILTEVERTEPQEKV